MKKLFILLVVVTCFAAVTIAPAVASDTPKIERGIVNTSLGWAELPIQAGKAIENKGILYGLTIGLVQGGFYTIGRIGGGALDLVTMPFAVHPDLRGPILDNYAWD